MARRVCTELWENFFGPLIAIIIVIVTPIVITGFLFSLLPERVRGLIAVFVFGCGCAALAIATVGKVISIYWEAERHCQE